MPSRKDQFEMNPLRRWDKDGEDDRGLTLAEAYSLWLRNAPTLEMAPRQTETKGSGLLEDTPNQRMSGGVA